MFLMPVIGYLYVTAGGFGVTLFGAWDLPNPMGERQLLATAAKWTHIAGSYALLLAVAGHVGLVLRHQLILKGWPPSPDAARQPPPPGPTARSAKRGLPVSPPPPHRR